MLYITDACSLCDLAIDLLFETPELTGHVIETIDIASDDDLLEQFAESIPVVKIANEQLTWPFSTGDISKLIRTVYSRSLE